MNYLISRLHLQEAIMAVSDDISFQPSKNPNSPINEWCRKMEERPDCIHIHTDYRDVPQSWVGKI